MQSICPVEGVIGVDAREAVTACRFTQHGVPRVVDVLHDGNDLLGLGLRPVLREPGIAVPVVIDAECQERRAPGREGGDLAEDVVVVRLVALDSAVNARAAVGEHGGYLLRARRRLLALARLADRPRRQVVVADRHDHDVGDRQLRLQPIVDVQLDVDHPEVGRVVPRPVEDPNLLPRLPLQGRAVGCRERGAPRAEVVTESDRVTDDDHRQPVER